MKKIISIILSLFLIFILSSCSSKKENAHQIRVGVVAGPESELMEVAKSVALKKYGLHVDIVNFSDYVTPNTALAQGDIDANAYQHLPFLEAQIRDHHYKMSPAGKTFLYPMGLYSSKIHSLSELKKGDQIGLPNDPSNEARALLLLQKAGLIELKPGSGVEASLQDIVKNPKNLKFVELDAPQLPRSLSDVAVAAINTTFAIPAGLSPKNALLVESTDSPYVNLIVVRTDEENSPKVKELVKAYQSRQVAAKAKELFGDSAIAAFDL